MARIKTLLADPNLRVGSTSPRASAAEFGAAKAEGLQQVARGLGALGQSADSMLVRAKQREEHLKALDDATTVNNSRAYLQKASTDFLADPENQGKDTYHRDYERYMDTARSKIKESGKISPEADVSIQSSFNSIVGQGYEHALSRVVAGKVEATSMAIENGFRSDMSAMLSGASSLSAAMGNDGSVTGKLTPSEVLAQHTEAVLNTAVGQSEALFKGTLPRRAKVMQEAFVREAVTRLADADTNAASAVLGKFASKVDADTFKVLQGHISVLDRQHQTELKESMTDLTKQALTGAYNGKFQDVDVTKPGSPLSEFSFVKAFGPSDGKRKHQEFVQEYLALKDARDSYDFLKGQNVAAQNETLATFQKNYADKPEGQRALHMLRSMVADNQELQIKDPPAWLTANNPAVGSAFEEYVRVARDPASDPAKAAAASQNYLDRLIQYQGPPPEGADELDAAMYLSKARPEIIPKARAKAMAEEFAAAPPDKFMQKLADLKQAFPTTQKLNLALSSLMSVPQDSTVDLSFQIFLQNMNNPNLPSIIEATRKSDSLKTLGDDKAMELAKAMNAVALPEFRKMARGLGSSREDSVAAAHKVTQNYARRLMTNNEGLSATDAVTQAYDQVVKFSLHTDTVNGYDVLIPKEVGSTRFPDEKMPALAQALQQGIEGFDSTDVMESHFPRAVTMLEDPIKRASAIRVMIQERARATVSADGTAMQLLMTDDYGNPYVLTDSKGKPYQVDIVEDLAQARTKLVGMPDTHWEGPVAYTVPSIKDLEFQWRTDGVPSSASTYWPLRKRP
jgi:hypothetical protein